MSDTPTFDALALETFAAQLAALDDIGGDHDA